MPRVDGSNFIGSKLDYSNGLYTGLIFTFSRTNFASKIFTFSSAIYNTRTLASTYEDPESMSRSVDTTLADHIKRLCFITGMEFLNSVACISMHLRNCICAVKS